MSLLPHFFHLALQFLFLRFYLWKIRSIFNFNNNLMLKTLLYLMLGCRVCINKNSKTSFGLSYYYGTFEQIDKMVWDGTFTKQLRVLSFFSEELKFCFQHQHEDSSHNNLQFWLQRMQYFFSTMQAPKCSWHICTEKHTNIYKSKMKSIKTKIQLYAYSIMGL